MPIEFKRSLRVEKSIGKYAMNMAIIIRKIKNSQTNLHICTNNYPFVSGDRCWSLASRKHKVYIYHFIFKCRIYIYTIHIYLHSGTRGSIRRIFSIVWYAEVFNSINHFVVICFNCRNKKAYQSYNSYYCQYQTNPFEA